MKKQHLSLLIFVALFCNSLFGQSLPPQEIRRIFPDTVEGGIVPRQIIAVSDGGFIVTGSISYGGFVAKLNASCDLIWFKSQLIGSETALNGIIEMPSGELLAVGTCLNCASGSSTRKALALKLSAAGVTIQYAPFGPASFNASANAVIRTANGKAAITGSVVVGSFLSPTNAFITVLNDQLQPDFWKEHNELYYDNPLALVQTSDGGFVLAGHSIASLNVPKQAQLFRTNSAGELVWKNTSTHINSQFNSVQETTDGRVVALGERLVNSPNDRDAYLAIHEAGGNFQSDRRYGSSANDMGRSLHVVEGGYLVAGVWGQPSQAGWSVRDWVSRLDENFDPVEENFYDSYLFAHSLVNVVPLSPDGRNFGYLSRQSFGAIRKILLYKKTLQGRHTTLTEAPMHYQLVPRDLANNDGIVVYQGSTGISGFYDELRLDVFRNDVLSLTGSDTTPESFSFQIAIPAELANYTFRLTGIKNGVEQIEAEACDVVAGDAFIIQGQSNALAANPYDPADTIPHAYRYHRNPFVRNFGLKYANTELYVWRREANDEGYYADARSGQWGLLLGEKIVEEQGIPVAIINGGIGGISINNMLPNPAAPHSTAHSYGRFYQRMEHSGLREHIRAIFFFQGETNALLGYNETVDSYKNKYLQLRSAWESDYDFQKDYLFQIRPGCWAGNFHIIQEAQRQVALEIPELGIMSATGMNHDGCHYHYTNGYERAGNDIFRLVAQDVYGESPLPNIYPPAIDSAWFSQSDHSKITLLLQHAGDTYSWTPGWETDFFLEGSTTVVVESGHISGNTVVLTLSEAPGSAFTGLSYRSHTHGSEAPVKNANGIGMLAFYNFPVADTSSFVSGHIEQRNQATSAASSLAKGAVYPNPNNGTYTLNLPWEAEATLYDVTGQMLQAGFYTAGVHQMSTDAPAGLYLLVLRRAEGVQTIRVMRQ